MHIFLMPQNRRLSFSAHFSHYENGENKAFQKNRTLKIGAFQRKKHVTILKMKNELKLKVFDFGAFDITLGSLLIIRKWKRFS